MSRYTDAVARGQARYGERYHEPSGSQFIPYLNSGERIKVRTLGEDVTGTVGLSGGWHPTFLLMRTRRSIGSSWTLSASDTIVAVQRGRKYEEVRS